ncbi:MAG: MaoC family dehydratase [Blastomonas fulva]
MAEPRIFASVDELRAAVGERLGRTDWLEITQQRIDQFAEATGDHQWIHVDIERAKAGPFGGPIAHGFLTLSLLPRFYETAFDVTESRMGVNYGLNRVRFMSPVPVGKRLRARMKLLTSEPIADDGIQMTWETTIELEGAAKPACVAESVVRRYR